MNDRFKFRFWREHYDGKFTLECADLMSIDGSAEPYNVGEGDVYCYHPGETIIEQCTGLKDKNGKLIFEGDIVKVYSYKAVVVWGCHGWYLKLGDVLNSFSNYHNVLKTFEIIGNVHENEELLK